MSFDEVWDYIIQFNIASEETLMVECKLHGNTVENLNNIIYCLTGYRSIEQYAEAELPWWDIESED